MNKIAYGNLWVVIFFLFILSLGLLVPYQTALVCLVGLFVVFNIKNKLNIYYCVILLLIILVVINNNIIIPIGLAEEVISDEALGLVASSVPFYKKKWFIVGAVVTVVVISSGAYVYFYGIPAFISSTVGIGTGTIISEESSYDFDDDLSPDYEYLRWNDQVSSESFEDSFSWDISIDDLVAVLVDDIESCLIELLENGSGPDDFTALIENWPILDKHNVSLMQEFLNNYSSYSEFYLETVQGDTFQYVITYLNDLIPLLLQ